MMFLFTRDHVDLIFAEPSRKTQTRRFHKNFRARVGSVHQVRTELFGKPHGHIRILRRWEEQVDDISEADAWEEGEYKPEEYIDGLLAMHRHKYSRDSMVKCYEFKAVRENELSDEIVMIVADEKKAVVMSFEDVIEHIVESGREHGETVIEWDDVKNGGMNK